MQSIGDLGGECVPSDLSRLDVYLSGLQSAGTNFMVVCWPVRVPYQPCVAVNS